MAHSIYKTLPKLAGTLATTGPWSSMLARAGYRVYPYQLGAMVRTDSANPYTTIATQGQGDFSAAATNYVMACSATDYGDSVLYVPDTSKVVAISTVPSAGTDEITVASPLVVYAGDYLLNLGLDAATPSYTGSTISIYSDPVGTTQITEGFVLTGSQGQFQCWTESGWLICDLLVTDSSGNPVLVIPGFQLGTEVLT